MSRGPWHEIAHGKVLPWRGWLPYSSGLKTGGSEQLAVVKRDDAIVMAVVCVQTVHNKSGACSQLLHSRHPHFRPCPTASAPREFSWRTTSRSSARLSPLRSTVTLRSRWSG